jgi:hypothetical protein
MGLFTQLYLSSVLVLLSMSFLMISGEFVTGPALRLRFTRRGNAFSITKKGPVDGMAVEGQGEEADGAGDGEAQDAHALGEGLRQRGNSDISNRMEGEAAGSDGPADQGKAHSGVPDGTGNSMFGKNQETRQTREIYRIPSHAGQLTLPQNGSWFYSVCSCVVEKYLLMSPSF